MLSCILIGVGTVAAVMGVSFYWRNIKYEKETSFILLMYGISSSIWCYCYGVIGLCWDFELCNNIRILGILAVDVFVMTEVFMGCKLANLPRGIDITIKVIMYIVTFIDWILFGHKDVDIYVRVGNWTTWDENPAYAINRNFHNAYVGLCTVLLLLLAIIWVRKGQIKREYRFVKLLYFANFLFLFCSFPDTFLPALGKHAFSTSGLGAAICTIVVWYGAVQLNYFDIRMGNIAENFLNFIDAGIIVFDMNKNIAIVNDYCKKILTEAGISPTDSPDKLFDYNTQALDIAFEMAKNQVFSTRITDKFNNKSYSMRLNALKDDFGAPFCYLCIFTDVTEEIDIINKLEIASRAKTDFLAQMSHEIRTPINSVLGMNEMILRRTQDPEILEYANSIDSSGRILLSLINNILDFSKIEDGHMTIVPVKYKITDLITGLVNSISDKAHAKNLDFNLNIDENLPTTLLGDDVRISQIILNLLSNAVKYTNEGYVTFSVKCIAQLEGKVDILFSIEDTGIGIKEEDMDRLCLSFERLDEVKNHNIEGTGLGITIVTNLLNMMDSSLNVKSNYGFGSCFSFVLRQEVIDAAPIGDYQLNHNYSSTTEKKKALLTAPDARILVVDDNKMNLKVADKLLSLCQISPDLATSGQEAIENVNTTSYDIIFLDHMMPDMDGIDTLHYMKDNNLLHENTSVIVLTANAVMGAKEEYLAEGFDDYLSKPIEITALEKLLYKYLPDELIHEASTTTDITGDAKSTDSQALNMYNLPSIEGIDWNSARRNLPNSDMFWEILEAYANSAVGDTNELNNSYNAGVLINNQEQLNLYRIKAHAMKNSAATIGATSLSEEAKALEYAARDIDLSYIKANHDSFIEHYLRTAQAIQQDVFHKDSFMENVINNNELLRNLNIIRQAVENYDTITLNNLSFKLSQKSFETEDIAENVHILLEAIKTFDIDKVNQTLEDLRNLIQDS